jgi:hypothetical protein
MNSLFDIVFFLIKLLFLKMNSSLDSSLNGQIIIYKSNKTESNSFNYKNGKITCKFIFIHLFYTNNLNNKLIYSFNNDKLKFRMK